MHCDVLFNFQYLLWILFIYFWVVHVYGMSFSGVLFDHKGYNWSECVNWLDFKHHGCNVRKLELFVTRFENWCQNWMVPNVFTQLNILTSTCWSQLLTLMLITHVLVINAHMLHRAWTIRNHLRVANGNIIFHNFYQLYMRFVYSINRIHNHRENKTMIYYVMRRRTWLFCVRRNEEKLLPFIFLLMGQPSQIRYTMMNLNMKP